MLEILYNDNFSDLSLVVINDKETTMIIDSDLFKYWEETFDYTDTETLLKNWEDALLKYYRVGNEDVLPKWREEMYNKSLKAFKQFLEEHKEELGD